MVLLMYLIPLKISAFSFEEYYNSSGSTKKSAWTFTHQDNVSKAILYSNNVFL